jgi:para-nitrobenzyl esterase
MNLSLLCVCALSLISQVVGNGVMNPFASSLTDNLQDSLTSRPLADVNRNNDDPPVVRLQDGRTLTGGWEMAGTVAVFKGVRYAMPPLGSRRWASPEMYVPSSSNEQVDASRFADYCIQSSHAGSNAGEVTGNEDCLYLNIYVGKEVYEQAVSSSSHNHDNSVPIAFWIHGGSYKSGSSNQYESSDLVHFWKGKGIVVTINYRLNVFGFLGGDALRRQSINGGTGNYGIEDQRLAMQWVNENIARFGGDKNQVMVYGKHGLLLLLSIITITTIRISVSALPCH